MIAGRILLAAALLWGGCGVPRSGLSREQGGADAAFDAVIDAGLDGPTRRDSCLGSGGPTEACNDRDDDCDGLVDEDPTDGPLWYRDADGDGFGDGGDAVRACASISGYVDNDGDCDDGKPLVHSGAAEECNDNDDDCDGTVDEDAGPLWYADTDGDGFGDPASSVQACARPVGYVGAGTDCDDTCPLCHPGYPSDVCEDGRDNDCDGVADGGSCECSFAETMSGQYIVCDDRSLAKEWAQARAYCQAHGGDLVSLNTSDEQDDVWALIDSIDHPFWIGGRDIRNDGSWRWVDGNPIADCDGPSSDVCTCDSFCNFRGGRPNTDDGDCLWVHQDRSGKWEDRSCSDRLRFVCEL